jgi:uncharacterized protein (TIGR02001 family)
MNILKSSLLSPVALAASLVAATTFTPVTAQAELSGNIGVHSKYLLRGIFEENDNTAVQGGLDYNHESGFYAGWWASNLGYEYDADSATVTVSDGAAGFENDFYAGYAGEVNGFSYDVSLLQYVYMQVDDSDLLELIASVGYGPVTFGFQYLLQDGWWGNEGDIYWKLGYSQPLPMDFTFDALLGYYTYDDSDNDELCNPLPKDCGATEQDDGFRHLNLTLSHPIASTGADMYIQYTFAGEDRGENNYSDSVVLGLTYGFDI